MGMLEDVPADEPVPSNGDASAASPASDVSAPASVAPPVTSSPRVVGAGAVRSLEAQNTGPVDFSAAGRNDPCPCGSGKKFKKCHGATA